MTDIPITATALPQFQPVIDAFKSLHSDDLETGSSFCIIKDGEIIASAYGGYSDRKKTLPWEADTLVPVFSTTKAIAALVIAWLVDQGQLTYDQKVADLWPEFGAHGKDTFTIGQIMSHQSGLSGITNPDWQAADWYDWDKTIAELAAQEPIWEPGTACGYHPVTYGYLAGEIARRADAKARTLGAILRDEFCAPHDIDFYIGTPESEHGRAAGLIKPRALSDFGPINEATRAAFMQKWSSPGGVDVATYRKFESPATNGHGTAEAIARLISIFNDGTLDGDTLISPAALARAKTEQISGRNIVLPFELTYAAGVLMNRGDHFYGPNAQTVGHSGWGGSCAFADPDANIGFAYVMNQMSNALLGDERPLRLIDALYECL